MFAARGFDFLIGGLSMSRLLGVILLAAGLLVVPLSHWAISGDKKDENEKVAICHFPNGKEVGHVIEVSENAVPAHVANHGDCTAFVITSKEVDGDSCRCATCAETCDLNFNQCIGNCDGDLRCEKNCSAEHAHCRKACACTDRCHADYGERCVEESPGQEEECAKKLDACLAGCAGA
jgi:hypothetical protein